MQRLAWIDNLRVMVIILVVILHTAVTYSGLGGWYYKEPAGNDMVSTLFFAFFQTFTQAYFMSLLFMVSGYFSRMSIEKKGPGRFLAGRFRRLGIPLLIYIFIVHPITVKLAYPDLDMGQWYFDGIRTFDFLDWTGPLWFVEALLIFTVFYVVFRWLSGRIGISIKLKFTPWLLVILILSITLAAFLIRLRYPIGTEVLNLQFSFFAAYIIMFWVGIAAHASGLFDRIDLKAGKTLAYFAFGIGVPLWVMIMAFSGALEGIYDFVGGWNWPSLAYAFWESMFCVLFCFALVGIFRFKVDINGKFQTFLSDNAFGVFVFHAPVLVATSMLFREVAMYPVLKFFIIASIAVPASYIVAWVVRRPKLLRGIFS